MLRSPNIWDFSDCLKEWKVSPGLRSPRGSSFHCWGLAAEKLLSLNLSCVRSMRSFLCHWKLCVSVRVCNRQFFFLRPLLLFRECCSRCRFQLCHRPLCGGDSVHLWILLMGTCRQCGSWSVAGHNHRKVIGRDSIYASLGHWYWLNPVMHGQGNARPMVNFCHCVAWWCNK